jgi:two-component system LytT family response regulator
MSRLSEGLHRLRRPETLIEHSDAFDLVFLDIELPDGSGFELLERLEELACPVVFVTAFQQYAVEAFRVSALDYLLKPIDVKELIEAVNKAAVYLKGEQGRKDYQQMVGNLRLWQNGIQRIAIPFQDGVEFVALENILYCFAEGNYTWVVSEGEEKFLAARSLKEFDQLLRSYSFFRIHRSHLINLKHIKSYFKSEGGYVLMSDGAKLRISQGRKEAFLECLNLM